MTKPQKQSVRQTTMSNSQSLTRHGSSSSETSALPHAARVPPSPPANLESSCSPRGNQRVSNCCATQTATLQQEETSNAKGHFVNLKLKQKSFYSFCSTSLPGVRMAREPRKWHWTHSPSSSGDSQSDSPTPTDTSSTQQEVCPQQQQQCSQPSTPGFEQGRGARVPALVLSSVI